MSHNSAYSVIFIVVFCFSSISCYRINKHELFDEYLKRFIQRRQDSTDLNDFGDPVGSVFSKCPTSCQRYLGNGFCDPECAIDECFWDLGDCSTKRECRDLQCPNDGVCRPLCELNTCVSQPACQPEKMRMRQIAVVIAPSTNASNFLKNVPRMENAFDRDLMPYLLTVVLESAEDGPLLFGHTGDYVMERILYGEENESAIKGGCRYKNGTIAVFSMRRSIDRLIHYNDINFLNVMQGLGLSKKQHLASVNLFTVPESVMVDFRGSFNFNHYRSWKEEYKVEYESVRQARYLSNDLLCGTSQ